MLSWELVVKHLIKCWCSFLTSCCASFADSIFLGKASDENDPCHHLVTSFKHLCFLCVLLLVYQFSLKMAVSCRELMLRESKKRWFYHQLMLFL